MTASPGRSTPVPAFDLHMHTTSSDGSLSPEELLAAAAAAGLGTVAVTDHDTVGGLAAAAVAGQARGVRVLSGIELSTTHDGSDLHLLGYGFEPTDGPLLDALGRAHEARTARARAMVERLAGLGIHLDWPAVAGRSRGTLTRPHIARAMVDAGYVGSIAEAFDRYLAEDRAAYLPSGRLTTVEAIRLLRQAGGYPFIAHPVLPRRVLDLPRLLPDLRAAGLAGLEAYYWGYSAEQSEALRRTAAAHGLMYSGGSDFHGASKPDIALGTLPLPPEMLEQEAFRGPFLSSP